MNNAKTVGILGATMALMGTGMLKESAGFYDSSTASGKKEFTAFDQMRLDKAKAKRDRKAAKLAKQGHL